MKKICLTAIILSFALIQAYSQTLFTYGNYKADAKDFLRAFNKNNQANGTDKNRAIKEYLDLYINSRLKIREAYDRRYDTLPGVLSEIENLRSQVIENYMSDPDAINRLTKEAFQRSLKDIHAAHIFISLKNADIPTIMRLLSRWYNIDIIYEGNIPTYTFTGTLPLKNNLSVVMQVLDYAGVHLNLQQNQNKIIVKP